MEKAKFYFMALLMAFVGLVVTSCSSDDDNNGGSPIVGTWELTKTYSDNSKDVCTFVFNSNNTGSRTIDEYGSSGNLVKSTSNEFSYKYDEKENGIILLWNAGGKWDGDATVIGNNLVLSFSGYFGSSYYQTIEYKLTRK